MKKKFISLISVIMTAIMLCSISANALEPTKTFATGDNSTVLIVALVGIVVAALVVVILLLLGNKKNKK